MLLFLIRHLHFHLLYQTAPSDPMRLYVFDTNQITCPGMQLQQLKHSNLVRPVDFESLDSFTGPQMDHLAVKIEINNTAVKTPLETKNISEPNTLCQIIELGCQPAINDTKKDVSLTR